MKHIRLILSLAIMVPAFAMLGAFATLDSGGKLLFGLTVGTGIGVFFGLLFGGVKGQWLDFIYGPEQDNQDDSYANRPD
jgi:hypothetical protein